MPISLEKAKMKIHEQKEMHSYQAKISQVDFIAAGRVDLGTSFHYNMAARLFGSKGLFGTLVR